jgi:hypothetical protein
VRQLLDIVTSLGWFTFIQTFTMDSPRLDDCPNGLTVEKSNELLRLILSVRRNDPTLFFTLDEHQFHFRHNFERRWLPDNEPTPDRVRSMVSSKVT